MTQEATERALAKEREISGGMYANIADTPTTVPCCLCAAPIQPNAANQCAACIRSQVDVTESINKTASLIQCRLCFRYHQPPGRWVTAEPESKELLQLCVKKLRGLQKVKLIDCRFIWTEPHSRRIKLKLTVQGEAIAGTILQQSFVAEIKVEKSMCDHCSKAQIDPEQWSANVQVRQHVAHKRTLLFLEQLVLRHNAHAECLFVRERNDGMDFYFGSRDAAAKMVSFLQSVLAVRSRHDKRHISSDDKSNTHRYRHTFSVEVVPLCKDDLCCLPPKLSKDLGGLGPLVIVTRVGTSIQLTDPTTLRTASLDATQYWRNPFKALMSSRQLSEYVVLDSEPLDRRSLRCSSKYALADATVARSADFGSNDNTLQTRTHLGKLLQAGDLAMGYDLSCANLNNLELEKHPKLQLPDVVLVRKTFEGKKRGRGRRRKWTLKRMHMEADEEGGSSGRAKPDDRRATDEEHFFQEIEEDPDLRSRIAVYKDPDAQTDAMTDDGGDAVDNETVPGIPIEEMLDAVHLSETLKPDALEQVRLNEADREGMDED